jgi:hypothetical protein
LRQGETFTELAARFGSVVVPPGLGAFPDGQGGLDEPGHLAFSRVQGMP